MHTCLKSNELGFLKHTSIVKKNRNLQTGSANATIFAVFG
jgi:hypothetical protein